MKKSIVRLDRMYTQVHMPKEERDEAVVAAHWVTASPHEWSWTPEQQAAMARYCLWASQRLEAIGGLSLGAELTHQPREH